MGENPFPKFKDGNGKPITRENFQANAWDLGHAVGKVEGWNELIEELKKRIEAMFDLHTHNEMYQYLEALRKPPSQESV